jgi:hypothetical protein
MCRIPTVKEIARSHDCQQSTRWTQVVKACLLSSAICDRASIVHCLKNQSVSDRSAFISSSASHQHARAIADDRYPARAATC